MESGEEKNSKRKWMVLAASTMIQAFSGTNFDFSSYSLDYKYVLCISQSQLNYLSMASDFGKFFGWCSGLSLQYFSLRVVLLISAFLGLFGYGLQWLLISNLISLPYFMVFLLCLVSGCSITWLNTVCYVLCIRNFSTNRSLALSLSTSFNGMSAALYSLLVNAFNTGNSSYLLLNGAVPFIISIIAVLVSFFWQQPLAAPNIRGSTNLEDARIFLFCYIVATFIGLYILFFNFIPIYARAVTFFLAIVIVLLISQFMRLGYFDGWIQTNSLSPTGIPVEGTNDDVETQNALLEDEASSSTTSGNMSNQQGSLTMIGEEHSVWSLISRREFWLYYFTYFCSGTIGIVYSNSLGQITQSLGLNSDISTFVTIYSACSFFGRLLAALPYSLKHVVNWSSTQWLFHALFPIPLAFVFLLLPVSKWTLAGATALIGLISGFVFSTATSLTSELFGPNSAGINHAILVTNVPLGSWFYGQMAALNYEANIHNSKVCIGRECYNLTFIWWLGISFIGVVTSYLLYCRTTTTAYHLLQGLP